MYMFLVEGLLIPLFGTAVGAVFVAFTKKGISKRIEGCFYLFAAGVMMAASVWSLLLPAIERSGYFGRFSFFPPLFGMWLGLLFLEVIHHKLPCELVSPDSITGKAMESDEKRRVWLLVFAIVIHNIPEGMAVGAAYAGWFFGLDGDSVLGALALSIGIAIQNIPEGAIVSLPLWAGGMKKKKACLYGILSGIVEPLAGGITIVLSGIVVPVMPCLLGFAAGAMIYVVVEELIPERKEIHSGPVGTFLFAAGFSVMMVLDVALG